jgi:pilus assembly protein CpaC
MKQCDLTLVIAFSLGLCGVAISSAQEPPTGTVEHREIQKLELTVGKSRVLDLPVAIKRASLANPDVADTVVLSPTQIYVERKRQNDGRLRRSHCSRRKSPERKSL